MNKEIIKAVLSDNQSDVKKHVIIPRNFTFESYGNYVLIGIRRAGKSYLLYQRIHELLSQGVGFDEILYVNFEDERLIGMTAQDLNLLLEVHLEIHGKKPTLFLDEIQNVQGWEKFARRMADTKHRVYITGSNAKMLSMEIQSVLGGRYIPVEIYPYSFKEFLFANRFNISRIDLMNTEEKAALLKLFHDFFYYGGFPEGAELSVKRDYLTSLYQKIYLGDIATRNAIENTFALRIMFKKIAESVKQPLSYNRIANIVSSTGVKVGTNTIIHYVEYSKDAWLISSIQNIAGKLVEKETIPKYYFTDNGILNLFLLDGNTSLLENIVAINLLRKYGRNDAVYYYNKDIEVDFYIPEESLAIQVCYNLENNDGTFDREVNSLLKLSRLLTCNKLIIITKDSEKTLDIKNRIIEVIPVWKWLLE